VPTLLSSPPSPTPQHADTTPHTCASSGSHYVPFNLHQQSSEDAHSHTDPSIKQQQSAHPLPCKSSVWDWERGDRVGQALLPGKSSVLGLGAARQGWAGRLNPGPAPRCRWCPTPLPVRSRPEPARCCLPVSAAPQRPAPLPTPHVSHMT
jgi:hypothetical protein